MDLLRNLGPLNTRCFRGGGGGQKGGEEEVVEVVVEVIVVVVNCYSRKTRGNMMVGGKMMTTSDLMTPCLTHPGKEREEC